MYFYSIIIINTTYYPELNYLLGFEEEEVRFICFGRNELCKTCSNATSSTANVRLMAVLVFPCQYHLSCTRRINGIILETFENNAVSERGVHWM
jgi:hypothetical protein